MITRYLVRRTFSAIVMVTAIGFVGISDARAGTTVTVKDGATAPIQQWVNGALTPTPNAKVNVWPRPCAFVPGSGGCASTDQYSKTADIYISPGYFKPENSEVLRGIFFHELGHTFDSIHLLPEDRKAITAGLGFAASSKWLEEDNGLNGFRPSPGEWFAESARLCFTGPTTSGPSYGFPYSASQVQWVCSIMRNAIARKPLVRTSYTQTLTPFQKFESATRFEEGTIRVKVTIDGKTWSWASSCTESAIYNKVKLYVNSCGKRVIAWTKGTRAVTFTFSGMPAAAPSATAGTVTKFSARKKKRKTKRH